MKTTIKYFTYISTAVLLFAGCAGNLFSQSASVNFLPASVEVQTGEPFFVEVHFDTDNVPVSVFDLHMLFDPEYLSILSIEQLQGDLYTYHVPPTFDNTTGKIDMAAFQIGKEVPTSFSVIKLELMPLAETPLTKVTQNTQGFPKTLLAYAGENFLGTTGDLDVTITEAATGVDEAVLTNEFELSIWPNPTSDFARISFVIPENEQVSLDLFDAAGKLVKQVFSGNLPAKTDKEIEVDLSALASGNYTCRLTAGNKIQSEKVSVIK